MADADALGASDSSMAMWSPLRGALALVPDRVTYAWSDLDALVGGLPVSAYEYPAFWKGTRTGWPGFTTVDVRVGESVTFVRQAPRQEAPPRGHQMTESPNFAAGGADMILIGCSKQKLGSPAPARDLYTSPLFRKGRAYAETAGVPWFVLSAQHGLVAPGTVLAPYDLSLAATPSAYRREWASGVLDQLHEEAGPLLGKTMEIHAGAAYVDALRGALQASGLTVIEPLSGLRIGPRLAWYGRTVLSVAAPLAAEVSQLVERLRTVGEALTPSEFLATGGSGLRSPGLYSWWVDRDGAADLAAGVGHNVVPGMIYAGLAGATRSRSGRKSNNTLWGRISTMHLGGRHEFSTFRLSLGSILASAREEPEIDEAALSSWMREHLRVVAVAVADADGLDKLESAILSQLDPPLNLDKVPRTPLRAQLTDLRRTYSRKRRGMTGHGLPADLG